MLFMNSVAGWTEPYLIFQGPHGGGSATGQATTTQTQAQPTSQNPCTVLQKEAEDMAEVANDVSDTSSWIAFASGAATALAGFAEVPSGGLDTPATMTAFALTDFFGGVSLVSGGAAAALRSYAAGNTSAIQQFEWGQLANLAAKAAASRIPVVKPWADRIGDIAENGAKLATRAKNGGC